MTQPINTAKPKKSRKGKSQGQPLATANSQIAAIKVKPKQKPELPPLKYEDLTAMGMPDQLAMPLFKSVTTMRGGDSVAEANFVAWLLAQCSHYATLRMVDAAGNVHFTIPKPTGEEATSLFVAHTDTVHHTGGVNKVGFDGAFIRGVDEPLGADDGAGVAILCYMMYHKVPGRYVFTRQEESGGIGATHIADTMTGVLKKYSRAIAFDRRGTGEVIVVQGGTRCASDEFGDALSDALNEQGLLYMTSDKGVYTDTKEFRKSIPECVNVATGYYQEHGSSEHLDLDHFMQLALAAVRIDWENLPTVRDPSVVKDDFDDFWAGFRKPYTAPKTLDSANYTVLKNGLGSVEEALFDWYWGRKSPLTKLMLEHLAKTQDVDNVTAMRLIDTAKVTDKVLDSLNLDQTDDQIIEDLLAIAIRS